MAKHKKKSYKDYVIDNFQKKYNDLPNHIISTAEPVIYLPKHLIDILRCKTNTNT